MKEKIATILNASENVSTPQIGGLESWLVMLWYFA